MRLLVLGGTEFVGRAVVEEAVAREWDVTVFNRGTHEPPAGARALRGDRRDDLSALAGGEWDLVVDTWAFEPAAVRDSAALLADRAARYSYISSRSVYAWPQSVGGDESAPVVEASADEDGFADYARAKRGGELGALAGFGADRTLLVRVGLILGPYENVGRLPWWLGRIAAGGPVLAPGPADAGIQYVDVRDLAIWTLDNPGLTGPCDVVSPVGHATMRGLLEACVTATGSDANLRWTGPEPILAANVAPWTELPVWLPPGELYDAFHRSNTARAVEHGLRCRPVEETVADTWAWIQAIGGKAPQRADRAWHGLSPEVEARLLAR